MAKKFFITTPIYYPNDIPHVGSAYSSLIADVLARYKRLLGYEVKFATGTDENSQKIVQKATEQGKDVKDFLDELSAQHKQMWTDLQVTYTDFIRTTDEDHKAFVQKVLQAIYDKDLNKPESERDIYLGSYEGLYCVGCEEFKRETDLIEKDGVLVCPDHLKAPEVIKEQNWFFRLKNYETRLKSFLAERPDFVLPHNRFSEVKKYLDEGLEDFSISRQNSNIGIPLPFDTNSITYVWFDALLNYLTVCQKPGQEGFASEMYHVLGKNIAKFHVLYRPAMIMAAQDAGVENIDLPKGELINGFLTVDGQKISKSLGNTVNPMDVVNKYGRDALVFYMFYDLTIGSDGDFSFARLEACREAMLSATWGNLVSRVTKLAEKNGITKGKFYANKISFDDHRRIETELATSNLGGILKKWYETVQACNAFMQEQQPWIKLKSEDESTKNEGKADLEMLLWAIKQLALISAPFLTEGFASVQRILGNADIQSISTDTTTQDFEKVFSLNEFDVQLQPDILYQKLEVTEEDKS